MLHTTVCTALPGLQAAAYILLGTFCSTVHLMLNWCVTAPQCCVMLSCYSCCSCAGSYMVLQSATATACCNVTLHTLLRYSGCTLCITLASAVQVF
jgi:hypothetical protein